MSATPPGKRCGNALTKIFTESSYSEIASLLCCGQSRTGICLPFGVSFRARIIASSASLVNEASGGQVMPEHSRASLSCSSGSTHCDSETPDVRSPSASSAVSNSLSNVATEGSSISSSSPIQSKLLNSMPRKCCGHTADVLHKGTNMAPETHCSVPNVSQRYKGSNSLNE